MRFSGVLILVLLLFIVHQTDAQTVTLIKGEVVDMNNKKLPFATVVLHRREDSALVKASATNEVGFFEIALSKGGDYYLSITLNGYKKILTPVFKLEDGIAKNLGVIKMEAQVVQLTEVVVESKKPMIEIKSGRTIFNVESSPSATGSNGLELLAKSPGVFVDNSDNISVRGKTGVTILVDRRTIFLGGADLANYLKSINSADVESIEVITNPGSEFNASGNGGVIHIKMKKDKRFGTNGTANIGFIQGVTPKGNASINLNNRNKLLNVYGTISYSRGVTNRTMELDRGQGDSLYIHRDASESFSNPININTGLDWMVNSSSTIGILVNRNYTDNIDNLSGFTDIYYEPSGQYIKQLVATNSTSGYRKLTTGNINYHYRSKKGFQLSTDFDHGIFRASSRSFQPNYYYSPSGVGLDQVINSNYAPINVGFTTGKIDFKHPVLNGNFGYGLRIAKVKTSNIFDFFIENGGVPVKLLDLSNQFTYTELVKAGYIQYQKSYREKFELLAGIRVEQTESKGELTRADGIVQADNLVKRSYLDFFPNINLTWTPSTTHTLDVGYGRRIDRPIYRDLNPFERKLDELTYEKGNAFLQPQYTHQVELSYQYKRFLTASVSYSHVNAWVTQSTDSIRNAAYVQPRNMKYQRLWSFNLSANQRITPWWRGFITVWFRHQRMKGFINHKEANVSVPVFGLNFQQSFSLGKGITAELSGFYKGKDVWGGIWAWKPFGSMDVGLQKVVLNKLGTIRLSYTDIFFTNNFNGTIDFNGLYVHSLNTRETRSLRLNFSYRFGNSQVRSRRVRETGSETESSRIR